MNRENKEELKQNNSSVAIKSGIWFTICNIITKSIGFLTTPLFTRILTKTEFGDYINFTTWMSIFLYITSLNLEASIIRARFDHKDDMDSYVSSMTCLSIVSTIVFFIITMLFIRPIENLVSLNQTQICALFLYLFFYPAIQLYQTKERFEYKYKSTVFITLLVVLGTSALSVVLTLLMEDKLQGRIIGTVLPVCVIGLVIQLIMLYKSKSIKIKYWKYALPFTLPFIPHLLSMYLLGSMDKVMIRQICGSEDLAVYGLAYTVGTIVSLLVNSMNGAFSPWLGEQLNAKNYSRIRKVSVPYVAFFSFFAIMAVLISPEVLLVLGGDGYSEARYVIPLVFAGCLMQFVYCMFVNVEQYHKRTIGMAIASIAAALFNYVTNYVFIRKYGYIAAAYTTFFSYFILMLLHMYLVYKIEKKGVFNNIRVMIISALGSLLLIGTNLIIDFAVLRYCIFAAFVATSLGLAYKYRNVIRNYIFRR